MPHQFPHYKSLQELYYSFLMPLYHRYRKIERRGLRVDFKQRDFLLNKYSIILEEKKKLIGSDFKPINFNSPNQVSELIFGYFNCPMRKDTTDDTLTALKTNVLSKNSKWQGAIRAIDSILECRKLHKCIHTYILARVDPDGRMRTGYRLTLETGRTSTSKLGPPVRWCRKEKNKLLTYGMAFQTITKHGEFGKDIRSMFIPDDGKVFVEVDGSQAEARVVMLLAEDYDTLNKMNDPLFDLHLLTTSWLYPNEMRDYKIEDKPDYFLSTAKDVCNPKGEPYRQRGKKTRHAGNYDMGPGECAIQMQVSQSVAKKCLDKFHESCPNVKQVFHKQIQDQLMRDRVLWTPIGRRREFFDKWGPQMFKEAYADIPQGTISDLTKYALMKSGIEDIVIESHDSFTFQTEPENLKRDCEIAKELMESEIDFSTCSLPRGKIIIPAEFKLYEKSLEKGMSFVI